MVETTKSQNEQLPLKPTVVSDYSLRTWRVWGENCFHDFLGDANGVLLIVSLIYVAVKVTYCTVYYYMIMFNGSFRLCPWPNPRVLTCNVLACICFKTQQRETTWMLGRVLENVVKSLNCFFLWTMDQKTMMFVKQVAHMAAGDWPSLTRSQSNWWRHGGLPNIHQSVCRFPSVYYLLWKHPLRFLPKSATSSKRKGQQWEIFYEDFKLVMQATMFFKGLICEGLAHFTVLPRQIYSLCANSSPGTERNVEKPGSGPRRGEHCSGQSLKVCFLFIKKT